MRSRSIIPTDGRAWGTMLLMLKLLLEQMYGWTMGRGAGSQGWIMAVVKRGRESKERERGGANMGLYMETRVETHNRDIKGYTWKHHCFMCTKHLSCTQIMLIQLATNLSSLSHALAS